MARRRTRSGFTLLEIVVALALMSLLAGAMAPLAAGQIKGRRIRATQERMEKIVVGLVGEAEAGSYGYLGDMGRLPDSLADLNERGGQRGFVVDAQDGIGSGYNGPYVPQAGAAEVIFSDAWGTAFRYSGAARLTSAGSDRAFGTADDLVFPAVAPSTTGNVSVSITGVPNDGAPGCLLSEDEADVFLAVSLDGERREIQLRGAFGSGAPFTDTDIHRGFHGLRLEGQGDFSGASARDVIELRGGNAHLRATLIQPVGPPPACRA